MLLYFPEFGCSCCREPKSDLLPLIVYLRHSSMTKTSFNMQHSTFYGRIFITCTIAFASVFQSHAQCPTCTPDLNCVSTDGFPAICPAELPAATAGVYYENYLTFYLPAEINDPENGINATLLEVTIASVTGLPFGMDFTINDPDGTFYPSQGDNYGCATICGTPILPGVYNINISVNALAEALGFEIEQSQSFFFTFVVEPGEQGNTGFSFDNQAGCGVVTSTFEALLNLPAVTTYSWNFGNDETSTEQFPPTQVYDVPGDYTVSLTTTISDYFLNSVSVSGLDDNWTGDVDDFLGSPDVWFVLTDGDGNTVYSSGIVDNSENPSWSNLNIQLSNPPYSISFTDDDLISADDGLGNAGLSSAEGTSGFDTGSGTTGTIEVSLNIITEVVNEEIITVFPIPDPAFNVNGTILSYSDPDLTGFVWFLNGEAIDNQFGPSIIMDEPGLYSCIVTNLFGCTAESEEYLFCPDISITWDELNNQLFVDDIYLSYQWYFNGLPMENETDYFVSNPTPGNYGIEVTTDFGCTLGSEVLTVTSTVFESNEKELSIYPNPVKDILYIEFGSRSIPSQVLVYDIVGHKVISEPVSATKTVSALDVSALAPGVYFVECGSQRVRMVKN